MLQTIRESFFQCILNFVKTLEEISNVQANFLVNVGDSTSRECLISLLLLRKMLKKKIGVFEIMDSCVFGWG